MPRSRKFDQDQTSDSLVDAGLSGGEKMAKTPAPVRGRGPTVSALSPAQIPPDNCVCLFCARKRTVRNMKRPPGGRQRPLSGQVA